MPGLRIQFARIRSIIVVRYSGQQKFPTSRYEPDPAPPPVDSPNPWPRTPVSATALPAATSLPRAQRFAARLVGRLRHCRRRSRLRRPRVRLRHRHLGRLGRGRTASRFALFGAASLVCTGRPPIDVMPPFCAAVAAATEADRHDVGGGCMPCEQQAAGQRRPPRGEQRHGRRPRRRPSAGGRPAPACDRAGRR